METKHPVLIAVEGADGVGKSTQVNALVEHLRSTGRRVAIRRYPERVGPIGKIIDAYLRKEIDWPAQVASLLFSADRHIQATKNEDVDVIICDRYIPSGLVYGKVREPQRTWEDLYHNERSLRQPDLVFYLHGDGCKTGEERGENTSFQTQVLQNYHEFFNWITDSGIWKNKIYQVARCDPDLVSRFIQGKTEIFFRKSNL